MAPMLEVSVPKGVSLRLDLRDGLPPVEADAAQLRQIVLNLVVNGGEAVDPRQRGTVLVRTSVEACGEGPVHTDYLDEPVPPGQYSVLEVADTGGGMDAETIARIFNPFFSTKFTGRGLGLPAALGVVHGHHGFIQVRSEVGRGSTFRILLPVGFSQKSSDWLTRGELGLKETRRHGGDRKGPSRAVGAQRRGLPHRANTRGMLHACSLGAAARAAWRSATPTAVKGSTVALRPPARRNVALNIFSVPLCLSCVFVLK